mgnify:FL=1
MSWIPWEGPGERLLGLTAIEAVLQEDPISFELPVERLESGCPIAGVQMHAVGRVK